MTDLLLHKKEKNSNLLHMCQTHMPSTKLTLQKTRNKNAKKLNNRKNRNT